MSRIMISQLYKELKENYNNILTTYKLLDKTYDMKLSIHPAGQWILDNMYIIEQQYHEVLENKHGVGKLKLPVIKTRNGIKSLSIYHIAHELVENNKGYIDQNYIKSTLIEHQKAATLTSDELSCFPVMLKIALIKFISGICLNIANAQFQKIEVEKIFESRNRDKDKELIANTFKKDLNRFKKDPNVAEKLKSTNTSYVEYLAFKLKEFGSSGDEFYRILNDCAEKLGFTVEEAIVKEHMEITKTTDFIARSITALKHLAALNYREIFEKVNKIDETLMHDYTDEYSKCDYKTKTRYRNRVIKLAKKFSLSETYVASKAVECSIEYKKHVGFFLSGEEKYLLNKSLNKPYYGEWIYNNIYKKIRPEVYVLIMLLLALLFDFGICTVTFSNLYMDTYIRVIYAVLMFALTFEASQKLIDYLVRKFVSPKILPRFDFAKTIDEKYSTYILMPSVINSFKKIDEMIRKMEVTYLANRSDNMYYMLLGDCVSSKQRVIEQDSKYVRYAKEKLDELNKKYPSKHILFNFIYRKRQYSNGEEAFMGWERKRGAIKDFNELVLGILSKEEIESKMYLAYDDIVKTKYAITIDEDTQLSLNTAKDLVAIIAHPLNQPKLSKNGKIVKSGHALIQPAVGLDVEAANKSIFSKIFGGFGGLDVYTTAISNTYEDLFNDAIFCGKGIYDIELFEKLLSKEIPENLVLSHDLLEGSYLRAGLASDIQVEDGFPANYVAYMKRNHRWYRGDMQIIKWLLSPKSPLTFLSKFKIFDNIRRPMLDVFTLAIIIFSLCISPSLFVPALLFSFLCYSFGHILGIFDTLVFGKNIHSKELLYIPIIHGKSATFLLMTFDFLTVPYRAYVCLDAFIRSIYRMCISKKHLLEWTTAEVLEKTAKTKLSFYYSNMLPNVTMASLMILLCMNHMFAYRIFETILAVFYLITPIFAYLLGKNYLFVKDKRLSKNENDEILEVARRTWKFFDFTMTDVNNYLPTDNFQETRRYKFVNRTSSTNIGFGILAIIDAFDLGFIDIEDTIQRLNNIMNTVDRLEKWNGHLLNWYNIKTLEPLRPRFISTVDSGNFLACIYVLKEFIIELKDKTSNEKDLDILRKIYKQCELLIKNTDFTALYDASRNLFSIGFAQEEGKLVDSYYDMLMSENRTTSLIAIASRQITSKHWFALGRKMAKMDGYKGLVSWSGTAFEYFMPYLFSKSYPHTLYDQSLFFAKYSQKLHAKRNKIPWGISESAFAVKDSQLNYQYKAFGIPWLGLKRGLNDSLVVSPYASMLMVEYAPVEVYKNMKELMNIGLFGTFGFYESIDYTKDHLGTSQNFEIVKTYMAHHQGMTLTAINNYLNNSIIKKRFHADANIAAVEILLKERERMVASIKKDPSKKYRDKYKEEKSKYTTSITYHEYNKEISNIETAETTLAILTGNNSSLMVTSNGGQYFRFKNKIVNRQKIKSIESSYNNIYITDTLSGATFVANNSFCLADESSKLKKTSFYASLDTIQYFAETNNLEVTTSVFLMPEYNIEVQKVSLYNNSSKDDREIIINTYMEPALTDYMTNIVHPSFNNLQIETYYDKQLEALVASKRKKNDSDGELYVFTKLVNIPLEQEIETEKSKLKSLTDENAYDGIISRYPLWPVMSHRTKINLSKLERQEFYYVTGIFENKYKMTSAIVNLTKETIEQQRQLSIDLNLVTSKYLKLEEGKVAVYNRLIYELLFENKKVDEKFWNYSFDQSMLWKYSISGDIPILEIKIDRIDKVGIINDIVAFMEYVKNRRVDLDIVIIIEGNKYSDKMFDYIKKVLDRVTFLDYTKGNIYLFNEQNMSLEDRNLFDFVSKKIVDNVDTFLA